MLSPAQIERFERDGFLAVPGVFSQGELESLRRAFDRLEAIAAELPGPRDVGASRFVVERPDGVLRIHRVVGCGAVEPELGRIGADARLTERAARLLGGEHVVQLLNQAHFKLPGDGVAFGWHQDSVHRRYGTELWRDVNRRGSYVQCVLAIDDVTADSGPLRFAVGSHLRGHREPTGGTLPPDVEGHCAIEAPTLAAGGLLLFGPYVYHASSANRSKRPRRILINGYASPGANRRDYPWLGTGRLMHAPTAAPPG